MVLSSPRRQRVTPSVSSSTRRSQTCPRLPNRAPRAGRWSVSADGSDLTGGRWFAEQRGDQVHAGLDVTERWRPRKLPLLMRIVTAIVPLFRRWPTTYHWRPSIGSQGEITVGWSRTAPQAQTTTAAPRAPEPICEVVGATGFEPATPCAQDTSSAFSCDFLRFPISA